MGGLLFSNMYFTKSLDARIIGKKFIWPTIRSNDFFSDFALIESKFDDEYTFIWKSMIFVAFLYLCE